MDNDSKINLDKEPTSTPPSTPTPPPTPDEEWAKKLHLNFDPEAAASTPTPPPPPAPEFPETPQVSQVSQTPPPPPYPAPGPMNASPQYPAPNSEQMPKTYLVWAVVSLILCCLPASIVAIIYSAQVSSKFYARDYEGARRASERAQIWIIVSIVLGVISMALYLPLTLLSPS